MNTKRKSIPYYNSDREYESPLHQYRVAHYLTCKELAEKSGVTINDIFRLANGTTPPVYIKDGTLRPSAQKLCKFFNVGPDILFPRYICTINRSHKFHTATFRSFSEYMASDPYDIISIRDYVKKILSSSNLTHNELKVINEFFKHNDTYHFIGIKLNTTTSNVGALLSRAVRKIRGTIIKNRFDGCRLLLSQRI